MIPKIKLPYYEVKIPDTNDIIHIKPYTIEVEKYIIGLDKENVDLSQQLKICREVLKFCIVEDYNIDELSMGTILWLFLKCYEISVRDYIEFYNIHKCDNGEEGKIQVKIFIKDIKYDYDNSIVRIPVETEEGKYYLEYGSLKLKSADYLKNEDDSLNLLSSCLNRMYDETGNNEIDLTMEDKVELTKSLSLADITKVGELIDKIQKPYFDLEYDYNSINKEYNHNTQTLTISTSSLIKDVIKSKIKTAADINEIFMKFF